MFNLVPIIECREPIFIRDPGSHLRILLLSIQFAIKDKCDCSEILIVSKRIAWLSGFKSGYETE